MIVSIQDWITHHYHVWGVGAEHASLCSLLTVLVLLILVGNLLVYALRKVVAPVIGKFVERTSNRLDDYLLDPVVLHEFWRFFFFLFVYNFLPHFGEYTTLQTLLEQGLKIMMAIFATRCICNLLSKVGHYTVDNETTRNHALVGIVQFAKLIVYFLCSIVIVSFVFGKSPVSLVAGLGAVATVLMLVFKDSILGLVAGIQLSVNEMLKPGDWVTIEKQGVDGIVKQVSLTTVKIQNFDNTISTIPPYTLVSESFRNWENVFAVAGRQVKRSFNIDSNSLHYLSPEELAKLFKQGLITHEQAHAEQPQVNLTLFRSYVVRMLRAHPDVNKEYWVLARLLQATACGVPMEIYFFLADTRFERFEDKSATCQEQIIATMPAFGLRLYQSPTGADMQILAGALGGAGGMKI